MIAQKFQMSHDYDVIYDVTMSDSFQKSVRKIEKLKIIFRKSFRISVL